MTVIILGAIWGLLLATRVLRGDEDARRWELFLSGRTRRGHAAAQAAIGLAIGLVALWAVTFALTAWAGSSPDANIGAGASFFFVSALLSPAAMFMAIGMFVSEVAASRRDANLIGAAALAGSYLVRMVADSDPSIAWLRWASPIGWIEQAEPLTGSRPIAFVPVVVLIVVLAAAAIRIASARDLGASVLASHDRAEPRTVLLGDQAD